MAQLPLIPKERMIRSLGAIYAQAGRRVIRILSELNPETYGEINGAIAIAQIREIVTILNAEAASWSRKSIKAAYNESKGIAKMRLDMIGAEKKKRRLPVKVDRHEKAINRMAKITTGDLFKANYTILKTSEKFLAAIGYARRQIDKLNGIETQAFSTREAWDMIRRTVGGATSATSKYNAGMAHLTSREVSQKIMTKLLKKMGGQDFITIKGKDGKERNYNLKNYSEMVARTRMRESQTDATIEMCKEYDNDLVQFSQHDDPCEKCAEFEGQVFSLSGDHPKYPKLPDEAYCPVHPNCLLPGTRVESPGGFIAGLRGRYSGPAIEAVFTNGARVSVTINHMFLTPGGFAPAYLLREGDNVFCCPSSIRPISIDPNNHDGPAVVEDIFSALLKTCGMTSGRVPAAAEYLHGDGGRINGDIDVVGAYSFLRSAIESSPSHGSQAMKFDRADARTKALAGEGDLFAVFNSLATTADRIMGGLRSPSSIFLARAGGRDAMTITDAAKGNTAYHKPSMNSLIRDMEALRQIAFEKSGLIKMTQVVNVRGFEFNGHVYDLHSPTSLYIANGIISSNCEHNLNPTSDNALRWRNA